MLRKVSFGSGVTVGNTSGDGLQLKDEPTQSDGWWAINLRSVLLKMAALCWGGLSCSPIAKPLLDYASRFNTALRSINV